MKKGLKRALSIFLVVLMMLTSAPLEGFVGVDLPDWFSTESKAVGVSGYSAGAAAAYAEKWWNSRNDSIWSDYDLWGGDCANFVAQALYAGGIPMTSRWYFHKLVGMNRAGDTTERTDSWPLVEGMYKYLLTIGGQKIDYPSASQISMGDVIIYDWDNNGRYDHSAICTGFENGVPKVACHYRKWNGYRIQYSNDNLTTDWTMSAAKYSVIKLYGNTCSNSAPSYDVYMVTTSSLNVRSGPSTAYGKVSGVAKDYIIHVTEKSGDWGKCKGKGIEGWVCLKGYTKYITHVDSIPVGHSMGDWRTTKNSTCTTNGEQRRDCSKCNYYETRSIGKSGHKKVEATCTTGAYCSVCKANLGGKLGHNYPSDWTTTTEATCIGAGMQKKVCTRCYHTITNPLAKLGHNLGDWKTVRKATCILEGLEKRTCTRCTYYQTRVIPKTEHPYGAEVILSEPTCTEVGTKMRTCTYCGLEVKYNYGLALGHEYGEWYLETPATETTPGVERCDCIRNDSTLRRDVIEHEHDFSVWETEVVSTCTEDGYKVRTCSICDYKEFETIVATGHKLNELQMGSYPQSRVEDADLIEKLNGLVSEEDLISYNYYSGNDESGSMNPGDFMKYADVEYNGAKYRYVQITKARPATSIANTDFVVDNGVMTHKIHSVYSYQRYNGYLPDDIIVSGVTIFKNTETYWFKFEPLKWRVLDQDTGLVLCETIVDTQPYCETIYESADESCYVDGEYVGEYYIDPELTTYTTNYEQSSIREWLNDDFYNTAFTDEEKALISVSTVVNDDKSVYGSATTEDKIFIPSYDEITNNEYHFDHTGEDSVSRVAVSSDYAQCQGVLNSTTAEELEINILSSIQLISYETLSEDILNRWWLRTDNGNSLEVKVVNAKGNVTAENDFTYEAVIDNGVGIRPAMRVEGIEILRNDKEPTCTEAGYKGEEYCFVCDELLSNGHTLKALGHNYVESKNIKPTCTENGIIEETCTRCGDVQVVDEPIFLRHYMSGYYRVKDPTCIEEGLDRNDCLREGCDYYEEIILEKLPHIPVKDDGYAPTCEETGLTDGEHCDFCGTILVAQEIIPALGHNEGIWICTNEGYEGFSATDKSECEAVELSCGQSLHFELRCTRCINEEVCNALLDELDRTAPECNYVEKERVESTCTIPGHIYYVCSVCGHDLIENLTALGHLEGEAYTVDPTCIDDGYTAWDCQREGCDHTEIVETADALGHAYAETVYECTCTSGGYTVYVCERVNNGVLCGDTYTDGETDPLGHDMLQWEIITPATCEEKGLRRRDCSRGDYYEEEEIEALGHNYQPESTVDPTCMENGYTHYVCENDSSHMYDGNYVPSLGHDYTGEWTVTDKADCLTDGAKELHCIRINNEVLCDEIIKTAVIEKRSHNWSDWETTVEPTCEETGLEKRNCLNTTSTDEYDACSAEEENVLKAIGHAWDNGVIDPDSTCKEHGTKTYTCQNNNSHKKTETVDLNPDNHVGETYIKDEKAATCTEDGYTGDKYCSDCNALLQKGEAIEKLGHDMSEWKDNDNGTHTRKCERENGCTYSETEECKFGDWVVTKEATCTEKGSKKKTCTVCGYVKTEEIGLKAHTPGEAVVENKVEPKCEESGSYDEVVYCTECPEELSRTKKTINAHGHDYHKIPEKSKAPDYDVKGFDYYECSYNPEHNYEVTIDALIRPKYTATFILIAPFFTEPQVLKPVTFEHGETYIDEPVVTQYDNYTFAWDEYQLKNEDITIYGRYTEIEPDEVTQLEPDKKAENLGGGIVNISLEAKADSKTIKIISQKAKPVDVVLVLDQSGSMTEYLGNSNSGVRKTKQKALIECADEFVNKVYLNAKETGADHRVAIVGFANSEKTYDGTSRDYQNTTVITTSNLKPVQYNNITDSVYANALLPIMGANGEKNAVFSTVFDESYIKASGATAAHLGLEMASNIFSRYEHGNRERIVLFITDGVPTHTNADTESHITEVAALAIERAKELKTEQYAKIYSVGVHADADAAAEFTSADNGVTKKGGKISYDFNRFLHAVSSNYPNAEAIKVSEMGEGSKNSGYYLAVNNTDNLSSIFSKILYGNVYEIVTFDKVTLVDTISKEFTMTIEQETEMRERLAKELGLKNEDITVTRNTDGTTTVRFENVRAKKVYNTDGSSYYSAKVSFNVSADEDSLGKTTNVDTNTEDAGVEYDGNEVSKFKVQTVNLDKDRNIIVFKINGTVYRIEEAKLGDAVVAPESELAKWNIPENTVVNSNCAVFEAELKDTTEYVVTWVSEDKEEISTYTYGSTIVVPEAAEKEGYSFVKWSPSVPATMPNYNLTFTAVYAEKHDHEFVEIYKDGSCTDGVAIYYECACGETKTENIDPREHDAKAVVSGKGIESFTVEYVKCSFCGKTNQQSVSYKVVPTGNNTVIEMNLEENEVLVQPNGYIKIRVYIGEENMNKSFDVYRVYEDRWGREQKVRYTPVKENGFLIFDADHFSFYVISEVSPETEKPIEEPSYGAAYCAVNGHDYSSAVTAPTCTADGFTTYTCSVCDHSYKDNVTAKLGHDMSKYVVTKIATCKQTGLERSDCSRCDEYDERTIAKTAHNYVKSITKATCTAEGYTTHTCSVCKDSYTSDRVPALDHADSNADGKCDRCGYDKTQNCSCNCHKGGIAGFFFKLILFFQKLFKMNKTCLCGVNHY